MVGSAHMMRRGSTREHSNTPGANWPMAEFSTFVECGGLRWHVQRMGDGPVALLLHGTGASTHSWRDLATNLSHQYSVIMCDLPGHGFTTGAAAGRARSTMSLIGMSSLIARLLVQLNIKPDYLVGHSAGAALCCQLVLDNKVKPRCIVSINGALLPFPGLAGQVFSPLARLLAVNPMVPRLVSWQAKKTQLANRLLNDTGSAIDAAGKAYYAELLRKPKHVAGALSMMANWNLDPLSRQLCNLKIPLHLIVGAADRTVSPKQGREVSQQVATSTLHQLPGLGHLAHEESPQLVAELISLLFASKSVDTDKTCDRS